MGRDASLTQGLPRATRKLQIKRHGASFFECRARLACQTRTLTVYGSNGDLALRMMRRVPLGLSLIFVMSLRAALASADEPAASPAPAASASPVEAPIPPAETKATGAETEAVVPGKAPRAQALARAEKRPKSQTPVAPRSTSTPSPIAR